jgi:hypothetical protein
MIAANRDPKYDRLLQRAGRALGTNSPVEAVRKVRAIVGARHIPDSEVEAQKALEALQNGNIPTPAQITALEIVIRLMRPVMLSHGGALDDLPETANKDLQPTELKDAWSAFRDKIRPYIGSIGRIEGDRNVHVGTGFVVGNGLIATNRHVLAVLTNGSEALMAGACADRIQAGGRRRKFQCGHRRNHRGCRDPSQKRYCDLAGDHWTTVTAGVRRRYPEHRRKDRDHRLSGQGRRQQSSIPHIHLRWEVRRQERRAWRGARWDRGYRHIP